MPVMALGTQRAATVRIVCVLARGKQFPACQREVVGHFRYAAAHLAGVVVPAKHGGPEPVSVSAGGVSAFCCVAALLFSAPELLCLVAFAFAACDSGGAAA